MEEEEKKEEKEKYTPREISAACAGLRDFTIGTSALGAPLTWEELAETFKAFLAAAKKTREVEVTVFERDVAKQKKAWEAWKKTQEELEKE